MKDKFNQEVKIDDWVLYVPNLGYGSTQFLIAQVLQIGTKKIRINIRDAYWKDSKPKWIENFIKLPEDFAREHFTFSIAKENQGNYPKYEIVSF